MIQALLDCVRAWWRVDRIRASPREGRLLRLHPPCLLVIQDRLIEIVRRVVGQDAEGPFVVYDCHDGGDSAQLLVRPIAESSRTSIRWIGPDSGRSLAEEEVSVFQPAT